MSIRTMAIAALLLALACSKREQPVAEKKTAPPTKTVTEAPVSASPAANEAKVGAPMPAYTAKLLDGSTFDLANEKGNVVLLNLWATWCGPCRYEIPELEKLHKDLAGQKFKVVGVSVDEGDPKEVQSFVTDQKVTYPIVLDPEGRLAALAQTTVLPTSLLVDRQGKVVWVKLGIVDTEDQEMQQAIAAALKS